MKFWCRSYVLLVAALVVADAAAAQGRQGAPNVMQSLSQGHSSDQPVEIESNTLEVREKNKTATFAGDVQVVQGDTTMKCQTLVVFYDTDSKATPGKPAPAAIKPTPGMPQGAQSIRRIEARGGVTVITKDQNATGELGIFDMKTNTITLSGNVIVSQGPNVMHGERVVVDMTTGISRVESSGKPGQSRVRALIQPGKNDSLAGPKLVPVGPAR
jgi:lipopolysaccharide export system protein LptA